MDLKKVQSYCKDFRKTILRKTAQEMEDVTGIKKRNFFTFENGMCSKLDYIVPYYETCNNSFLSEMFLYDVFIQNTDHVDVGKYVEHLKNRGNNNDYTFLTDDKRR